MAVIFEDDFEDGTIAYWSNVGSATPTVVTSPAAYHGTHSLRCLTVAQQVRLEKTFTSGTTFGVRFATQRAVPADEAGILFRLSNTDITRALQIQNVGAALLLRYNAGGGDVTLDTGPSFTEDTWFLVEVKADVSANPWQVGWKVDGVDQGSFTPANAATAFDRVNIGNFGFDMTWEVLHDYVKGIDQFAYITEGAAIAWMGA